MIADRTAWLTPVIDALDRRREQVAVFFRDDDGGWAPDRLAALLEVFEAHATPIDVAVIPEALDRHEADTLRERAARGAVHLHQHGRRHVNHEPAGRKCEFGPARPLIALSDDVRAGWDRLGVLLGEAAEPIFTPPWNRCVDGLGEVLREAGHAVLSRDRSAGRLAVPGLADVPVSVDWYGSRHGVRWSPAELADRIAAELAGAPGADEPDGAVGIMLHHAPTDATDLAAIESLLEVLRRHDAVVATNIAALAAAVDIVDIVDLAAEA